MEQDSTDMQKTEALSLPPDPKGAPGPVEQYSLIFEDAELLVVYVLEEELAYASISHFCNALEIRIDRELSRIRGHAVLRTGLTLFNCQVGLQMRSLPFLKLSFLAGWLLMLPVSKRLTPEQQQRLFTFQTQAIDTLNRLYGPGAQQHQGRSAVESSPQGPGLLRGAEAAAYAEGLAIARLALEQGHYTAQKVGEIREMLHPITEIVTRIEQSLPTATLPTTQISEAEASAVADLVKQAGIARTKKMGLTEGSLIGQVYGELYRKFHITSYKHLTQAQLPIATAWLTQDIFS